MAGYLSSGTGNLFIVIITSTSVNGAGRKSEALSIHVTICTRCFERFLWGEITVLLGCEDLWGGLFSLFGKYWRPEVNLRHHFTCHLTQRERKPVLEELGLNSQDPTHASSL